MKGIITKSYRRPCANPISVAAGDTVAPDPGKATDIEGWIWCTAQDGRSGWTPRSWLRESQGKWQVTRDFNAIELTVSVGDRIDLEFEESGFYWAKTAEGLHGWVPCECVQVEKTA